MARNVEILSYLAGFFDGEGCARLEKPTRCHYRLRVSVVNTNRQIIELFRKTFGGTVSTWNPKQANRKKPYQWVVTDHRAYEVLCELQLRLMVKAEQAAVAIEFHERAETMMHTTPKGAFSPKDPQAKELCRDYKAKFDVLNA